MEKVKQVFITAKERTGWRDNSIEQVHKEHGLNTTTGFIGIEFYFGKPTAVVRYVSANSVSKPTKNEDKAIMRLCSNRKYPIGFYNVTYNYNRPTDRIDYFKIKPMNKVAESVVKSSGKEIVLTESDFIRFLYDIRGNKKESDVIITEMKSKKIDGYSIPDDQIISKRHRDYGWNVPMIDIDYLLYDNYGYPKALVEYKEKTSHYNPEARKGKMDQLALISLADGYKEKIPYLLVRYDKTDYNEFRTYGFNDVAKNMFNKEWTPFNGTGYFELLKSINDNKIKERTCPYCGSRQREKNGQYGKFYGCSDFPVCRYTENITTMINVKETA